MVCGEALMAASAWQCVAAVDAIAQGSCANATVNIVGTNEKAIAAQFTISGTSVAPATSDVRCEIHGSTAHS